MSLKNECLCDEATFVTRFMAWTREEQNLAWLVMCVVVAGVHLTTLNLSPVPWQDETQIVDYGRHLLEQRADVALTWTGAGDRPQEVFSIIGCIFEELAYRLFPGTSTGARLFTLLGALFSGTMLVIFGRRCGVDPNVGLLLAGIWVLDPTIVQSYRGGRLDTWACGLVFAALIVLAVRRQLRPWRVIVASLLLWAAFQFWPTSLAMFPLTAFFFSPFWRVGTRWKKASAQLTLLAACFIIFTAVFIQIILPELTFSGLVGAGHAKKDPSLAVVISSMFRVVSEGAMSGLTSSLGLIALASMRRGAALMLLALAASALLLLAVGSGHSHPFRGLYLVAWAPVLVIVAWGTESCAHPAPRSLRWFLFILIIGYAALSLGARNANALLHRAERDPTRLIPLIDALPSGVQRVGTNDLQLYYLLRGRGIVPACLMFEFYDGSFTRLAARQDVILVKDSIADHPWAAWRQGARDAGFTMITVSPLPGYVLFVSKNFASMQK